MKNKTVRYLTAHDLDENWQLLANAICIQAVRDYEYLISDKPSVEENKYCNLVELNNFSEVQIYTSVKLDDVLGIIKRNYEQKFKPYVEEHCDEIMKSWAKAKKLKNRDRANVLAHHPYICPNCHGFLYQGSKRQAAEDYILCSGCNLNALIPERYRKGKKKK